MQNLSKYLKRQYMPICFCYNMISCRMILIILTHVKCQLITMLQHQNLTIRAKPFTIQNGILYRLGQDNKFNILSFEILIIVQEFHTWIAKGNFSINITYKILDARYWWSTLYQDNIHEYYKTYDAS
jgi:hypothetical protein